MEKGSLVGKRLLLVRDAFTEEQIQFLEANNDCEIISSIKASLQHDYTRYDHFLVQYTFEQKDTNELFSKINATSSLSRFFLITPRELTRLENEHVLDVEKVKIAQQQINEYIEKYPDFFKKVDPDFYKKRLINFGIEACGATPAKDIAIFSYDGDEIGLISKSLISEDILTIKLQVNISFGNEKEQLILELKGKCSHVEFEVEDMDKVYCYEFTITEPNETYTEVIEAIQQQEEFLNRKMAVGGFE